MANELTLTLSFTANKPPYTPTPLSVSWQNLKESMAGTVVQQGTFVVATGAGTFLNLASFGLSTPHIAAFYNCDTVNSLLVAVNNTSNPFALLDPNGFPLFVPLHPSYTSNMLFTALIAPVTCSYLVCSQ